jgi:hypothetical protein
MDIRAAVSYGFVNGIVTKYDSEDLGRCGMATLEIPLTDPVITRLATWIG